MLYKDEALSVARAHVSHTSSELDWALIELGDACYYNKVKNPSGRDGILVLGNIKNVPPIGQVMVLTRRGVVHARGGGSFSSLKLPHVEALQSVWQINLEQNLG